MPELPTSPSPRCCSTWRGLSGFPTAPNTPKMKTWSRLSQSTLNKQLPFERRSSEVFMKYVAASFLTSTLVLLVVLSLSAQNSGAPNHATPPADYSFNVPAHHVWFDTGLDLNPGDRVHITGSVLSCETLSDSEKAHLPLPSAPGGALLAKVHAEANPLLATPEAEMPINTPSRLYLGVNGWRCHGTIPARVHVDWHGTNATP